MLKMFLLPCMTGCKIYLSDGCIWFFLQDGNGILPFAVKCLKPCPMGNSWHNAKVLDAHPLQPTQHPCKAWIPHHTPTLPAISHPSATCLATALWTSPGPAVFPPIPHNWIEHLWRLASIKTVCQPLKCFGGLWTMREKGARGKKNAWDHVWKHLIAKLAGLWHGCAWQGLTANSGKHSQVDVCLMKNCALN